MDDLGVPLFSETSISSLFRFKFHSRDVPQCVPMDRRHLRAQWLPSAAKVLLRHVDREKSACFRLQLWWSLSVGFSPVVGRLGPACSNIAFKYISTRIPCQTGGFLQIRWAAPSNDGKEYSEGLRLPGETDFLAYKWRSNISKTSRDHSPKINMRKTYRNPSQPTESQQLPVESQSVCKCIGRLRCARIWPRPT